MPERLAIYYAPSPDSTLWRRAAEWLDRDPAGHEVDAIDVPGLPLAARRPLTQSARRYGFHATLKPPMALAPGRTCAELEAALAAFATTHTAVSLGRLMVADIEGFRALIPETTSPKVVAFAAEVVEALDAFRALPSPEERQRRHAAGLTPRQSALLDQYGYPYVMEEFRFHMTITDRLAAEVADRVTAAARGWFAPVLDDALALDRLALFHEPEAGAPFQRIADFPLTGQDGSYG